MTEPQQLNENSTEHEKNVNISKNGGQIRVSAKLHTPTAVCFNEEAPAFWNIKLTGITNSRSPSSKPAKSPKNDHLIFNPQMFYLAMLDRLKNGG